MADITENYKNLDLEDFTITSTKPSMFNDGLGTVKLSHVSDSSKDLEIIQQNCTLNEDQVKRVYALIAAHPHLSEPIVFNNGKSAENVSEDDLMISVQNTKNHKQEMIKLTETFDYKDKTNSNEDADFVSFCKELKKERPDMDVIKAGILKFGYNNLSDSQKAFFMNALFPKTILNKNKLKNKLGLQNLRGIKNALTAMQQLNAEGKISNQQMLEFLTRPHPKTGRNILTVTAMNTAVAERQLQSLKNPEDRKILTKKSQIMNDIAETLSELDADVLNAAINTSDQAKKLPLSFAQEAKKSSALQKVLNAAQKSEKSALRADARTDEAEPIRIGSENESDALTFSASEGNNLNVATDSPTPTPPSTPTTPDGEGEEVSAKLEKPKRDSEHGKSSFDFSPVKEQDLIQYLYNVWFLGLINYIMKKGFTMADGAIDYLLGDNGQTPSRSPMSARGAASAAGATPATTTPTAQTTTPQAAVELSPAAKGFAQQINSVAEVAKNSYVLGFYNLLNNEKSMKAMLQCVRENIGKNPDKWSQVKDFNPAEHKNLIPMLNSAFSADKETFNQRLDMLEENPQVLKEVIIPKNINVCSLLATIDYVRKNPDKELVGNSDAAAYVHKNTMVKMFEIIETISDIERQKEIEYKYEHNINPEAKLTKKQKLEVAEAATKDFGYYLNDVCITGREMKDLLCQYHTERDATARKLLEQEIRAKQSEFDKVYNRYRSPDEERAPVERTTAPQQTEKMGLVDAAEAENAGKQKENTWNAYSEADLAQNSAEREMSDAHKAKFNEGKRRVLGGNSKTKQSRGQTKDVRNDR